MPTKPIFGEFNEHGELINLGDESGEQNLPIALEGGQDAGAGDFRRAGGIVAAYYYGEWTTPGPASRPAPWDALQPYSDRLPVTSQKIAAGVYGLPADNADAVTWEQQQAKAAGIDVFIHNAYWFDPDGGTNYRNITDASLNAHSVCPVAMPYAIQWSNHGTTPINTLAKFRTFLTYVAAFWSDAQYWKINGKPVFYILDADQFQTMCMTVYSLADTAAATQAGLAEVRAKAVAAGFADAFIVSGQGADSPYWVGNKLGDVGFLEQRGYDAETVYNRMWCYTDRWQRGGGDIGADYATRYPQPLTRFAELQEVYRNADDWITNTSGSTLPHFVPAICGRDERPWKEDASYGLGAVASEDNCAATPAEFLAHLRQQREFAIKGARLKPGVPPVINIYAWNEYGEGAFLCPSRRYGWQLLDQIKRAFGAVA